MTGTSTIGLKSIHPQFRSLIEMLQLFIRTDARLKLRGRQWEIHAHEEFNQLLTSLAAGVVGVQRRSSDNAAILLKELKPLMEEVTRKIHHTHPNYDLEGTRCRYFPLNAEREACRPARGRW